MANKTINLKAIVTAKNAKAAEPQEFEGNATVPAELPALPTVTENKTYFLKLVNGVLTWVEQVE